MARKLGVLVSIGAVVGALAAPSLGAGTQLHRSHLFVVGGQLVSQEQLGAFEQHAAGRSLPTNGLIQIGGRLVRPEDASAFQAQAGPQAPSSLVQIGGKLVLPSRISTVEAQLSPTSSSSGSSTSSTGFDWRATGLVSAAVVALALAIGWGSLRRRRVVAV